MRPTITSALCMQMALSALLVQAQEPAYNTVTDERLLTP